MLQSVPVVSFLGIHEEEAQELEDADLLDLRDDKPSLFDDDEGWFLDDDGDDDDFDGDGDSELDDY